MDRSALPASFLPRSGSPAVDWVASTGLVDYEAALAIMENRAAAIVEDSAPECVWLLQHPPIYTAGTSARDGDLPAARFPTYRTGRGGQYTYHGPGQRVIYVMLDLKRRTADVRAFVAALESWIVAALATYGLTGETREDRVGVWVARPPGAAAGEDKIAALGIRVRRWVSFHGLSVNIAPDLSHFADIVPCGISDPRFGVTSLAALGLDADLPKFDRRLRLVFERLFGETADAGLPGTPLAVEPARHDQRSDAR